MPLDYPYLEEVLAGFHRARAIIKTNGNKIDKLGFVGNKFDFYRFPNRFRLAVCLSEMRFVGYTEETADGYLALTKVFLMWSAFDCYTALANSSFPHKDLFRLYPRHHIHQLAKKCRELDPEFLLVELLEEQAKTDGQERYLGQFAEGHDYSVLTLAACIRHIYAHGNLTAHPNGLPAENMNHICHLLSDFLRDFMRWDFMRRVQYAENFQPPTAP